MLIFKNKKSNLYIGGSVVVVNDLFYEYGGSNSINPFLIINGLSVRHLADN
jgi:hypothetical protein